MSFVVESIPSVENLLSRANHLHIFLRVTGPSMGLNRHFVRALRDEIGRSEGSAEKT